jgi:O-antigen biosynthesis protein
MINYSVAPQAGIASAQRAEELQSGELRPPSGAILFVLHGWGGGTEVHVNDLRALLKEEGTATLVCKVDPHDGNLMWISTPDLDAKPLFPPFDVRIGFDAFVEALRKCDVRHIHIHHLAGFVSEASDFFRQASAAAGILYDVTVHDYMSACPRINLIDRSGVYCGEPSINVCESCIAKSGSSFGHPNVREWRERYQRLFAGARLLFVPDVDVKNRMERFFPGVRFEVRAHPEPRAILPPAAEPHMATALSGVKRIALLGAFGPHKGSALLEAVVRSAKYRQLPLEFVVVGYTDRDETLRTLGVEVTGKYPREQATELLAATRADFVWFSSVCPETYCFTLTSAFDAGLYPVAFDFGAIATRIKAAGWGRVLPIETMLYPNRLAEIFAEMSVPQAPAVKPDVPHVGTGGGFFANYYGQGTLMRC